MNIQSLHLDLLTSCGRAERVKVQLLGAMVDPNVKTRMKQLYIIDKMDNNYTINENMR